MKIELPFFDLSIDRIKEGINHYLLMEETHLIYHMECFFDKVPDVKNEDFEPQSDVFACYHSILLKNKISGVDVEFAPSKSGEKYDAWVITLNGVGSPNYYAIKVPTEALAYDVQNKILAYLLLKPKTFIQKIKDLFC